MFWASGSNFLAHVLKSNHEQPLTAVQIKALVGSKL